MKNIIVKTLMLKGQAGGTIDKIEKTGTSGLVDTYTVTYNDGDTSTFEVTNGNGIVSIEHTSSSGYYDTYTITFTDGTTDTFTVKNGEDGAGYEVPAGSVLYFDSSADVPEGYEASSNPDASVLSSLQSDVAALKRNSAMGAIVETSLSALESSLLTVFGTMTDQEVRIYYVFPNFTSAGFFAGAAQVAILTRKSSGVYRVAYPNICCDAYYYDSAWHYSKASMSSVTP